MSEKLWKLIQRLIKASVINTHLLFHVNGEQRNKWWQVWELNESLLDSFCVPVSVEHYTRHLRLPNIYFCSVGWNTEHLQQEGSFQYVHILQSSGNSLLFPRFHHFHFNSHWLNWTANQRCVSRKHHYYRRRVEHTMKSSPTDAHRRPDIGWPSPLFSYKHLPNRFSIKTCSHIKHLHKSPVIEVFYSNTITLCDKQSKIKVVLVDAVQAYVETHCTYNLEREMIGWATQSSMRLSACLFMQNSCATDCDVCCSVAS